MNESCTNYGLVNSYSSEAIKLMTVKCRPYYLPREFTAVFVIIVYIPPGANANEASTNGGVLRGYGEL